MKSIKEKSNEYAREFVEPFVLYYTKDEVRQFEAQHEDSFEAGANYVLEKFVDIVNKNTKPYGVEDRAKMVYDMLILIEQLKK